MNPCRVSMGRIIYYNAIKCDAYLRDGSYAAAIEPHIVACRDLEARKAAYQTMWRVLNPRPYFERSGGSPNWLDVELLYPIPRYDPDFSQDFRTLCLSRASALMALDKPIKLFWSGGIDSTAALCALLIADVPRDQLQVIYNHHSVAEYPRFFAEHIENKLDHKSVERRALSRELSPDVVGTTGEPGDQLFGNLNKFLKRLGWENAFKPWRPLYPRELVDVSEPIVARAPRPIETLFDFCWWMNFCLKYQQTSLRLLANLEGEDNVQRFRYGMHPFYETAAFQQWCMSNPDQLVKTTFESMKYPAKDLIFEWTRDREYHDTKLKVGSLQANRDPSWLFILSDGTVVPTPR